MIAESIHTRCVALGTNPATEWCKGRCDTASSAAEVLGKVFTVGFVPDGPAVIRLSACPSSGVHGFIDGVDMNDTIELKGLIMYIGLGALLVIIILVVILT